MAASTVPKQRLDVVLTARGLAESRPRAQALIRAGQVVVDDARIDKPGTLVREDVEIRLRGADHPFVSRGGQKLDAALASWPVPVAGRVAMDVGASTGGFTHCLLLRGVKRVHTVDVGYGQLAWSIATDPRVVVHDRENIRHLPREAIGDPIELCVVDCSFIALTRILPSIVAFLAVEADVVALVKPQFELGRGATKKGIVRDEALHREAIDRVQGKARALSLVPMGEIASPVLGQKGNQEYLVWLRRVAPSVRDPAPEEGAAPDVEDVVLDVEDVAPDDPSG